jgi:hypothetical protein
MRKNKISTLVFGKFRKIAVNSFHHFKSHNRIKSFQGVPLNNKSLHDVGKSLKGIDPEHSNLPIV